MDLIESHRRFDVPVIDYPPDFERDFWGLPLTLQVAADGRVTCYLVEDHIGTSAEIDDRRRALIRQIPSWRYAPFESGGAVVPAIVREHVHEQRLPARRRDLPEVPLGDVEIALLRSGCYGTCPSYQVRIRGDGTVVYNGRGFVDVLGEHAFDIPVEEVASLVDLARASDLWSMDGRYRAPITDHPTYRLRLTFGDQVHEIEDYVGTRAGMPRVVREFEDAVDRVGKTGLWTELSLEAVGQLATEGFDFESQEGANLLLRAVTNPDGADDLAMLRLIELGTPLVGGEVERGFARQGAPTVFEAALRNGRAPVVDELVLRGALLTEGGVDQAKLDAAFRDAIRGGRLAVVQRIWNAADGTRPSLYFQDSAEGDDGEITRRTSVLLLLDQPYRDDAWEGREIAQWLAGLGVDLKASGADGDTVLHSAVDAGDIEFVRFLLEQGVDVDARGEYDLPAMASADSEDIVLLLLDAGAGWKWGEAQDDNILRYAREQHWGRVLAWIEAQQAGHQSVGA